MRKIMCMLAIAALSLSAAYAQGQPGDDPAEPSGERGLRQGDAPRRPSREEIQSLKIAFMTSDIGLTSDESQKFWPLYNQYWEEKRAVMRQRRDVMRKIESGAAVDADIDEMIRLMKADADVLEKYIPKFKEILPVGKVAKIFTSEDGFKRHLLHQANERGGGR